MSYPIKATALSIAISCALSAPFAMADLQPEPIYKKTVTEVINTLQEGHYNRVAIDDSLSQKMFDRYLKDLDPTRIYFYQSDIDGFSKWRDQLDDQLKAGELTAAYDIFNRYQQRTVERLNYMIDRLKDDSVKYDFTLDESFDPERKDAPWATDETQMNELWRKRVKNALLSLKLADKSIDEAREVLIKRYKAQLQRTEQTKNEDVFQTYLNSLTALYDPHTSYFSPQVSENFQINMSLSLEGIGAVLQSEDETTKIVSVVPGGPAELSGQLKAGDKIIGVGQGETGDIEDIIGQRLDDVVKKIRGPKGSVVRLQVVPADAVDPSVRKIVKIERNKVKLEEQAAKSDIINVERNGSSHKIGVIKIPAFYLDFQALQSGDPNYKSTTRDVKKLIEELKPKGIEGLVIDLRENGGGSLREANELVGLFINRGPTVQIRDPEGRIDVLGDFDPSVTWAGPVTVLVNRLSASASEIFAGAMQDYHRGLIVGSRTFGKGTVQTLQPIDYGQLKLTHAKFYRISGDSTQDRGVIPDISMPTLYDEEKIGESALDQALPWDQVRAVRHAVFSPVVNLIPTLRKEHEQRVENNPDFIFMNEQVAHLAKQKEQTTVSLNEAQVEKEKDEAEQWLLKTENQRRLAKHEEALKKISELDSTLPKDENGKPINPDAQALLHESAEITLDMVNGLKTPVTLQANANN